MTTKTSITMVEPLIKITYRYDIPISIGNFTNDVGWGCMVRSTQMLLANALYYLQGADKRESVIKLFIDDPEAPLSIHKYAMYGDANLDVDVGQWFGPLTAALTMEGLIEEHLPYLLNTYVARDQTLVINHILQKKKPTLVFLPCRLGMEVIDKDYIPTLKAMAKCDSFVGICGGMKHSATYIFDIQDTEVMHVDPHYLQRYTDDVKSETFKVKTENKRTMRIEKLHPSLLVSFLLTSMEDAEVFIDQIQRLPSSPLTVTESAGSPMEVIDFEEEIEEDGFYIVGDLQHVV